MDEKLLIIAAEALRIPVEVAAQHWRLLPDQDGLYHVCNPIRGGLAVIVNKSGERLIATSGINPQKHLQAFLEGRRN